MSKLPIRFHSEDVSFRLRKVSVTRAWLAEAIKTEQKLVSQINIVWCSDAYLLDINQQYLDHDTFTDIITFDYSVGQSIGGDIFISLDRVRENARLFKSGLQNELHRVMIHGVLHLCGYEDKSTVQKSEMTEKEDYYLSLLTF